MISDKLKEVKVHMADIETELNMLETKNRKASGPRARKSIMKVKNILHQMRSDISDYVQKLPKKSHSEMVDLETGPTKVMIDPQLKLFINGKEIK